MLTKKIKTMNRKLFFILAAIVPFQSFSQYVLKEGYLSLVPKTKVDKEYKFKNLILYPVFAEKDFISQNSDYSHYTPLEEALKSGKVKITEQEHTGAQVNNLYIENLSADTVFIMAGQVIKGGKQDRVISDDRVLEPHSGKIDLSVFCVEHNRWTYKTDRSFTQTYSVPANSIRKSATYDKNQYDVWDKVSDVTTKQNASSSTGTYTALAEAKDFNKEIGEYDEFFRNAFNKLNNCVGFVGVSGDKIIGCDIFASNKLFRQQLDDLVQSYSTEAITYGKTAINDYDKVLNYLKGFLSNEINQDEKIKGLGNDYQYKGKRVHINTY